MLAATRYHVIHLDAWEMMKTTFKLQTWNKKYRGNITEANSAVRVSSYQLYCFIIELIHEVSTDVQGREEGNMLYIIYDNFRNLFLCSPFPLNVHCWIIRKS